MQKKENKQDKTDSLLYNTTIHTICLYYFLFLAIVVPEKSLTQI